MTIIDRVRSVASQRARSSAQSIAGSVLPGLLGNTAAGAIVRGIAGGSAAARAVIPKASAIPDLVLGEVDRRTGARGLSSRQAEQLQRQKEGRGAMSAPGPAANSTTSAGPTGSAPTPWTGAPLYGGLTLERSRQLFVESAMTAKAWKNLFFVSIEEYRASDESPAGAGPINLLALDVSFSPCTAAGDVVQLGGANMDVLSTTDRVELRLTTLDDDRGSLERWFVAKADQASHVDGTFGLPVDYLVTVTVIEMDPSGEASPDDRMTHKFLMRPSNIDIELSRRASELKELPMAFVQFDSFMVPR